MGIVVRVVMGVMGGDIYDVGKVEVTGEETMGVIIIGEMGEDITHKVGYIQLAPIGREMEIDDCK